MKKGRIPHIPQTQKCVILKISTRKLRINKGKCKTALFQQGREKIS